MAWIPRQEDEPPQTDLQPQILLWSLLGHLVGFVVHAAIVGRRFASEAASANLPFTLAQGDPRTTCFVAASAVLMLQTVMVVFLALARWSSREREPRGELLSTIQTGLFCAVLPWVSPWHTTRLIGAHGGDIWDREEAVWSVPTEEEEALCVLLVFLVSICFAVYVPVRLRFSWVVPLCAACSFALLWGAVGSPHPESIPLKAFSIVLLTIAHFSIARRHEHHVKKVRSMASHAQDQIGEPGGGSKERPIACNEVAFMLSESLCLCNTSHPHTSFFGQDVEGLPFWSFLPAADRQCFGDLMARLSKSKRPECMPTTIRRDVLSVKVLLVVADTGCSDASSCGSCRYLVALATLDAHATAHQHGQQVADYASIVPASSAVPNVVGYIVDDVTPEGQVADVREDGGMRASTSLQSQRGGGAMHEATGGTLPSFVLSDSSDGGSVCFQFAVITGTMSTQTEMLEAAKTPPTWVDAGVNTTVAMDGFSFRCLACQKPPKLPSSSLDAGLGPGRQQRRAGGGEQRQRRQRRRASQELYQGNDFDGTWLPENKEGRALAPRARSLRIRGFRVTLASGEQTRLVVQDGTVCLLGAQVFLRDRHLIRTGKGGVTLVYCLAEEALEEVEEAQVDGVKSAHTAGRACKMRATSGAASSSGFLTNTQPTQTASTGELEAIPDGIDEDDDSDMESFASLMDYDAMGALDPSEAHDDLF